eukprot:746667-Hanusia_phi.AAC.2
MTGVQVNHMLVLDAADDAKSKYEALDQVMERRREYKEQDGEVGDGRRTRTKRAMTGMAVAGETFSASCDSDQQDRAVMR